MTSRDVCYITKDYLIRLAVTPLINTPLPNIPQKLGERFQSKLSSVADVKDLELKTFDMVFPELSDFENDKDSLCAFFRAVIQIFECIYRLGNLSSFPELIERGAVIYRAFEATTLLKKDVVTYGDFYKALTKMGKSNRY
jgi:hypothetical protein